MQNLTKEQKDKLELLELRKKKRAKLRLAFTADKLSSEPTPVQKRALTSSKRIQYIIAGNRSGKCLPGYVEVITHNRGMVQIKDLRPGDEVYDENARPIKVKAVSSEGLKEVVDLTWRGVLWSTCTADHRWLVESQRGKKKILAAKDFSKDVATVRHEINSNLGPEDVPHAYALGALLGDGCSRQNGVCISSENSLIPDMVAQVLGSVAEHSGQDNCTYRILKTHRGWTDDIPYYAEWCKGKYAHEKTCDIEQLRNWNRTSLLKFLAGLVDTEGSVFSNSEDDCLTLSIGMQASRVIRAFKWAVQALWQYPVSITCDDRDKYKNGPLYQIKIKNNQVVKRALKELDPYLVTPRKKYKSEYDNLTTARWNPKKVKLEVSNPRVEEVFDIEVDSREHLYCLASGLVTHNTTYGARQISWWFNNDHPYLPRPEKWGSGPITIIVMAQSNDSIEREIWPRKLQPLLGTEGEDYDVQRTGGYVKAVTHLKSGNTILFLTHSDAEQARRRAQSFTAHIAWIDEMPPLSTILTEMRLRVLTSGGYMYCTFTPLFTNQQIRKIVDTKEKKAEKFVFSVLDNPVFTEEERAEVLEEFRNMSGSEAEFRARLNGEWMVAGHRVYAYDPELNWKPGLSDLDYDPRIWPHAVIVDPAASGSTGLLVMARHPQMDVWFEVKSEVIKGSAFSTLIPEIEKKIEAFNVRWRFCDCAPSAFYLEALEQKINYTPVVEKADNKEHWIEQVNKAFANQTVFLTLDSSVLAEELVSCARKEDDPTKIIKASKYHTADCLRYFVVMKPEFVAMRGENLTIQEQWRRNWKEKVQEQRKQEETKVQRERAKMIRRAGRRR